MILGVLLLLLQHLTSTGNAGRSQYIISLRLFSLAKSSKVGESVDWNERSQALPSQATLPEEIGHPRQYNGRRQREREMRSRYVKRNKLH